jgi:hypothetical protein
MIIRNMSIHNIIGSSCFQHRSMSVVFVIINSVKIFFFFSYFKRLDDSSRAVDNWKSSSPSSPAAANTSPGMHGVPAAT